MATTEDVLKKIRDVLGSHTGSERELYEQLEAEADGWRMRLQELRDEEAEGTVDDDTCSTGETPDRDANS